MASAPNVFVLLTEVAHDSVRCRTLGLFGVSEGVMGMGGSGSAGGAEGGGARVLPGLTIPLKAKLLGDAKEHPFLSSVKEYSMDPLGANADNAAWLSANAAGRCFLCMPTALASAAS